MALAVSMLTLVFEAINNGELLPHYGIYKHVYYPNSENEIIFHYSG